MLDYPALLDLESKILHPLSGVESFLVGRHEKADLMVTDQAFSRQHFRIFLRDGRHFVERLNSVNPTYLNDKPLDAPTLLAHGDILLAGKTRFQLLLRPIQAIPLALPVVELPQPERVTILSISGKGEDAPLDRNAFPLSGEMFIGREVGKVHIPLPHPQVSRLHARIARSGTTATILDLRSANGTFVNGARTTGLTTLKTGDHIDIGPYALTFTGTALVPKTRADNVELVAQQVRRVVRSRETGKPFHLLDDVTLVIRPREFVCLIGPSGSGKSTLLSILSGRTVPNGGIVRLNGQNLHTHFEAFKQDIAVVPQKDVLHESLSVSQALWYTAKLRLPPDTSAVEVEASLTEMLNTVALTSRRETLIRHLSGGQVKRASLANEILCKPSLLFLDEVTSGLDEQTDREVMNLFRSLADAGKTVVCITHSLANVERTCHLVVVLTSGGKLAFFGPPSEALDYFEIARLGDVYDSLGEHPAEHWQEKFRASPFWQRYVAERLPAEDRGLDDTPTRSMPRGGWLRLFMRQTVLLTRRYAAIWWGDYAALLAMAGQAVVVALLLGFVFGRLDEERSSAELAQRSINLMFLLAVSSFWFGCNNAAKEIVKERVIYRRERDFNLLVGSYYASKLLLLTAFSAVQVVVLFGIVKAWCDPPGFFLAELIVLGALSFAGVTLGLAISALSATEEMAITLIPMAVIPQIIFSGLIVPLEGLSQWVAAILVSVYWGKRGLDSCLPESVTQAIPGMETPSVTFAVMVLLGHAALCIVTALGVLSWQTRRG